MPASSEASSLGVHRCLRIVAESLSALLLLSSIALTVCKFLPSCLCIVRRRVSCGRDR